MPRKWRELDEDAKDTDTYYFTRNLRTWDRGSNRRFQGDRNQILVPESVNDVHEIVEKELRLWGVCHDVHHRQFMVLTKAQVAIEFAGDIGRDSSTTPLDPPTDQVDGVRFVLE